MTETTLLTHETDYVGQAKRALYSQFRDDARLQAFFGGMGAATQLLEDACWDLLQAVFASCTGDQLDQWGDTVDERRGGLPDGEYRVMIQARIKANRSMGRLDELIEIAQIVTAPSRVVGVEYQPKHVTLRIYRDTWISPLLRPRVRALLQAIKPAGTYLQLEEIQPDHLRFSPLAPGLDLGSGRLARII